MPDPLLLASVQAAITAQSLTWTAGHTPLLDLTVDERRLKLGYNPGPHELGLTERLTASSAMHAAAVAGPGAAYPPAHDWRNVGGRNFISAVKDQKQCGSCVSFGTCATMEGTARIERRRADRSAFNDQISRFRL